MPTTHYLLLATFKKMVITYYGLASYKIQFGDTIIAFNPVSKESKYKGSKFGADLVMVSLNDPDYNGVSECTFGSKVPFVVNGPGEYETKDIYIKGVGIEHHNSSGVTRGGDLKYNTVYSVLFEGVRLCHLGGLNASELSSDVIEQLGEIDLLFVPILGADAHVLTPSQASAIATSLEAKAVIPMHVGVGGADKKSLQQFLKEYGSEEVKPIDKLTLRKKDLEGKDGDVIIIDPTN